MPKVINLDDRLIEAMQDGDESALGTVIQRYTAYVGAIVWNIVGGRLNEDDTKEIVSDVFYTLWKNSAKVRKGKLKAYLSSISRTRALDALRRSKQEISIEEDDIEIPVSGPEDEVVHAELYAALREALNALPEPDRTIFIRHYYCYQKTDVDLFDDAGTYRNSFNTLSAGPIKDSHKFSIDISDEPGAIASVATILAVNGINIKNIGIQHNREYIGGDMTVGFWDAESKEKAADILKGKGYILHGI